MATLCFIPSLLEATAIAFIGYGLFGMPLSLCFTMGFGISCISPSVMIPGLINLLHRGFGHTNKYAAHLSQQAHSMILFALFSFLFARLLHLVIMGW